jgi:hypothetical protein
MCSKTNKFVDGLKGFAFGLGSMFGASSFWDPVNDSVYQEQMEKFKDMQQTWSVVIKSDQANLTASNKEFSNTQMDLMSITQAFRDQLINESISKNSLFIALLFISLFIILFFLIV